MAIWYEAKFSTIKPIQVERATPRFVTLADGTKSAVESDWRWIRKTHADAKAAMIAQYQRDVEVARKRLEEAEFRLDRAEAA